MFYVLIYRATDMQLKQKECLVVLALPLTSHCRWKLFLPYAFDRTLMYNGYFDFSFNDLSAIQDHFKWYTLYRLPF